MRLVAISKTRPAEDVRAAFDAGQTEFGENRVQEALEKIDATSDIPITWHLVGHLQSNKARRAAGAFGWIHSVDRADLLQRIDAAAVAAGRRRASAGVIDGVAGPGQITITYKALSANVCGGGGAPVLRLDPVDNQRLARLCGALDANLRQIESALDVSIARRGARFTVRGAPRQALHAARALEHFYAQAAKELAWTTCSWAAPSSHAARRPRRPRRGRGCSRAAPTCTAARRTRSSTSSTSSRTTSPSASGPRAPARPTWRWPARWRRCRATPSGASCSSGPRSRGGSGSASWRADVVLPEGWFLTDSSIPGVITTETDGRTRIAFINPRPDSIDVILKARRR